MYHKVDEGKEHPIDYTIPIVDTPSNLGKGKVYHFNCPFGGKKVKTLYMAYGSRYFKSRQAYKHRIYYACQLSSRLDRHNDTYWRLDRQLSGLYKKHPKEHYKGKPTKAKAAD